MKWYLNSASGDLLHEHKFFTRKLKEHECMTMLIIAHQSTKGAERAVEIITQKEPSILQATKVTVFHPEAYIRGDYTITDFDAVYIKGGLFENWDPLILEPCGPKLYQDMHSFLFKPAGCYFGSSLGLYILFDQFETNPEQGPNELPSYWYDHGMAVFKGATIDTHFSPPQDLAYLRNRMLENLKNHPELKWGVQLSSDSVIEIDSTNIMSWKLLSGHYEVNKYYPEL